MRLLYILFAVVLILTLIPIPVNADKAEDSYAKMAGVKVVTSSNTDVTYTGKHWKENGNDKYEYVARIHQAPIYNEDGSLVDCSWHGSEDAWVIVDNVFSAQVIGSYITVTYQGKSMSWNPVVMIDSKEYVAKGSPKVTNDILNENYRNNVLEWDYGVCVRRVRVIEGLIQETWTFDKDPKGNVWIRDYAQTQQGFTWEIEPYGYDADGNSIAVNEYKQVAASVMASAKYPVTIDPTEVFVTSASDGYILGYDSTYLTARSTTYWNKAAETILRIGQYKGSTNYDIRKSWIFFDTSALPDSATISAAILSLYGAVDSSTVAEFNITIQSGMPTYPHDPIANADVNPTFYTGDGGTLSTTIFSTVGYNNISLNVDGRSWMNKAGTTKFCLRSDREIAAIPPTGFENVDVYSYEKGAGYRPTLYVTYSSSGPPDVTSVAASYVTKTTARVNGYLDSDGGEATTVWFNYWEWYDQNWSDCIEFSINASYVDSDLTNFPVLITGAQVNQSNPNFWTTVDVNGSDILFTDENGTKLNRELVSIDTTNMSMECYVNVSSIDDLVDTPIYMYYGNPAGAETNDVETWDANYVAVWHMNDNPNTSTIQDSTVNNYDGTKTGANEPIESVGAFAGGKAQTGDATNDRISLGATLGNYSVNDFGVSFLCKFTSSSTYVIAKYGFGTTAAWMFYTGASGTMLFRINNPGGATFVQCNGADINDGNWHFVAGVRSGDNLHLYIDNNAVVTKTGVDALDVDNAFATYLFARNSGNYFDGSLDDVRFSNTNPSDAWIESTYYSLMSPEDFCPVTDVFHETATQSKNTGDSFYSSLTGLTPNTLYGFRAMADQTQGTDYGAWLFFDTTVTLGTPSNVTCKPDSDSITLTWTRGGNTSYTYIRYKTGGYPTGTADGNAIPLQSGVDYVHTGLTSGVTYYYKMWGEDAGTYSATNSTTACTTYAGFSEGTPVPLPTTDTSGWSETPNGSVLTNNPLYALGNLEAAEVGVPQNTWWMLIGLGILISGGLFIYSRTRDTVATIGGIIIFGVIMAQMGLFPIWTMILFGLVGIGLGWKGLR